MGKDVSLFIVYSFSRYGRGHLFSQHGSRDGNVEEPVHLFFPKLNAMKVGTDTLWQWWGGAVADRARRGLREGSASAERTAGDESPQAKKKKV